MLGVSKHWLFLKKQTFSVKEGFLIEYWEGVDGIIFLM